MLKVFEAFAGIGTQRMALRNLHIPHKQAGNAIVVDVLEAIFGRLEEV